MLSPAPAQKTKVARPKRPALKNQRPRSEPSRAHQAENSPFFEVSICFHTNKAAWQIGEEADHHCAPKLAPDENGAIPPDRVNLKKLAARSKPTVTISCFICRLLDVDLQRPIIAQLSLCRSRPRYHVSRGCNGYANGGEFKFNWTRTLLGHPYQTNFGISAIYCLARIKN